MYTSFIQMPVNALDRRGWKNAARSLEMRELNRQACQSSRRLLRRFRKQGYGA